MIRFRNKNESSEDGRLSIIQVAHWASRDELTVHENPSVKGAHSVESSRSPRTIDAVRQGLTWLGSPVLHRSDNQHELGADRDAERTPRISHQHSLAYQYRPKELSSLRQYHADALRHVNHFDFNPVHRENLPRCKFDELHFLDGL